MKTYPERWIKSSTGDVNIHTHLPGNVVGVIESNQAAKVGVDYLKVVYVHGLSIAFISIQMVKEDDLYYFPSRTSGLAYCLYYIVLEFRFAVESGRTGRC